MIFLVYNDNLFILASHDGSLCNIYVPCFVYNLFSGVFIGLAIQMKVIVNSSEILKIFLHCVHSVA